MGPEPEGGWSTAVSETRDELRQLTLELMGSNVISTKKLRKYVGKCESFASLLFVWRPFLRELWAALQTVPGGSCPPNCIWTKMVKATLVWIRAFLNNHAQAIVRRFKLSSYCGHHVNVRIAVGPSRCKWYSMNAARTEARTKNVMPIVS